MNTLKTVAGVTLYECESETLKGCIEQAISNGINLDNADFSGFNLEGVNLAGLSMRFATFENTNLAFSNLQACDLSGSNFRRTNLFNANLQGSQMKGTDIHGANFSNANLRNVDFRSEILNKQVTICKSATFANSDMTNIVIEGYEFFDCNFSGAKIQKASLKQIQFRTCDLRGVDLTGANLYYVHINDSDLTDVILEGVNLSKTEFYGSDISNTYFGWSTLPIVCGNRNIKTNSDQRMIIANFLQNWLKNDADNLTDQENELLQLLNEYGSDINYTAALDRTKSRNK